MELGYMVHSIQRMNFQAKQKIMYEIIYENTSFLINLVQMWTKRISL